MFLNTTQALDDYRCNLNVKIGSSEHAKLYTV